MDKTRKSAIELLPILISILVSMIVLFGGCLIAAWLIGRETVEMDTLGLWGMGVLFLTGLSGGIVTQKKAKSKLLLVGCLTGVGTFCVMLCMGALFFEEPLSGVGQTFLLVVGSCLSAILVGTHRRGTVKNYSHRRRTG